VAAGQGEKQWAKIPMESSDKPYMKVISIKLSSFAALKENN